MRQTGLSLVIETLEGGAGHALAGFILLLALDGRGHVLEVAVERTRQGLGLGRLLFEAADRWTQPAGFCELMLTAYRDVERAPSMSAWALRFFSPGDDRPELRAIIDEKTEAGLARQPRVAMRRPIPFQTASNEAPRLATFNAGSRLPLAFGDRPS